MANLFSIAVSPSAESRFRVANGRPSVSVHETDFTNVAAVVLTEQDTHLIERIKHTQFGIPILIIAESDISPTIAAQVSEVFEGRSHDLAHYSESIEKAARRYEHSMLPPFFRTLVDYVEERPDAFDCPGHQGGAFFRKHPAGRAFTDFFGPRLFQADLCNADVALGDLLIHEGAPYDAQKHAAAVFHADKTYFILNGTSTANKVVLNALLCPGDFVLYDRNNHKSVCHGALLQAGAIPIYLETTRNAYGSIGGIPAHAFSESHIRQEIAQHDPQRATLPRPIRLAVIQLGTYDGILGNARYILDKIGHLCEYILFDSAWVGYEQFIPMLSDSSPLLLDLGPEDPGIFVTQSVHKQQAGFSQTSQIHKKDSHIKGQSRYINHKRVNNAYMMHASTSPFYPLFASLDVNAKMHANGAGQVLWKTCVEEGIDVRKDILHRCHYIRPFVPPVVHDMAWEKGDTEEMAKDVAYFTFQPSETWHGFTGYESNQYRVDPCKLQLITPGIDPITGEYEDTGIPTTVLASFLRERRIIPEKNDLNTLLFLLTPAESKEKYGRLVQALIDFECAYDADAPLWDVLPSIYLRNVDRYQGYTLRQLCQEMHDLYKESHCSTLQQRLFLDAYRPEYVMTPQEAHIAYMRGQGTLVPIRDIAGKVALEGALPYPPGVLCVQPGERWSETARDYFLTLEKGIQQFPGFAPEIQGVYFEPDETGKPVAYGYVKD